MVTIVNNQNWKLAKLENVLKQPNSISDKASVWVRLQLTLQLCRFGNFKVLNFSNFLLAYLKLGYVLVKF